jgi:N-sulfoglucosamine sulfohydrolase
MKKRETPNFLWVSFEDTNPFYGCYGDTVARTPNLDQLAAEGCHWTKAFSTAGVCAPARSAIITGMYPVSVGAHHMRTTHTNKFAPRLPTPYHVVMPHYVRCFTEYLRAAGYYCINNVKTDYQFEPPITAWDELSRDAHWRNRPDFDQPFFAVFNPTYTHESGMWLEKHPEIKFDPNAVKLPPYFPDTLKVREAMARMYTNIEYCDGLLGEYLSQLEEDGLAENTAVFHWSDHGPLPRGKRWPYDSGINVPLIVRWPKHLKPGSVCEDLVSTIDLGPTVLSIAGIQIPLYMQGQSFLGPEAGTPRDYIFASRDRYDESYDMVRAVRDKRFKYIRNYYPGQPYLLWIPYRNRHPIMQEMWRLYLAGKLSGSQLLMFQRRPVEELYDTEADPYEINNLAGDSEYELELKRLRKVLDDWLHEVGDTGHISESDMVRFWYPDGKQPVTATPLFVPICEENPGIEPLLEDGVLKHPALMQIYCSTQGASIAYTFDENPNPRWLLYTEPLQLRTGNTVIRSKAVRIGYKESPEAKVTLQIE